MSTKELFGPLTKQPGEDRVLTWNVARIIPTGEVLNTLVRIAREKGTPANDTTTELTGANLPTFSGNIISQRLVGGNPAKRHLLEIEATTDVGTILEAQFDILVGNRKAVGWVQKSSDETFPVSVDFINSLRGATQEIITGQVVSSTLKSDGSDTTADLITGGQVDGSKVLAILAAGAAAIGRHLVLLRATTDAAPNAYEHIVEVDVEASP